MTLADHIHRALTGAPTPVGVRVHLQRAPTAQEVEDARAALPALGWRVEGVIAGVSVATGRPVLIVTATKEDP
jgi:hypothetical protein